MSHDDVAIKKGQGYMGSDASTMGAEKEQKAANASMPFY